MGKVQEQEPHHHLLGQEEKEQHQQDHLGGEETSGSKLQKRAAGRELQQLQQHLGKEQQQEPHTLSQCLSQDQQEQKDLDQKELEEREEQQQQPPNVQLLSDRARRKHQVHQLLYAYIWVDSFSNI
mmetsp:Transcript_63512/g.132173  ORF Transcript_63512/g.132173 Transcript_63512/m.132173 type:complete len:126 (-) Transcript_63512:64-441(-)